MEAIFVHEGGRIDYTPTSDVAAGAVVVQGDLVGVATQPIKAGQLGSLAVEGVFDFAKATGTGTAIAVGTVLYWDDAANRATTSASGNKLLGKCVKAAADSDPTVRVKLKS
ncbi:MAG: DUF2190 family protein [Fimbriimonadales bacterium]|nr:DUF2190 family protein [Fimbriimonadales bacterium]